METKSTAVNLKRSHDANRDHFNYKGGGAGGGAMVPERKREREMKGKIIMKGKQKRMNSEEKTL